MRAGLSWGSWSAGRGAWTQAHEAYGTARVAADRLLGQHAARRDVEAWLSAIGDLSAQASYARCRSGEPRAAAEWLEWGRARVLSDALARARLETLAVAQPALAGRFREAAA